MELWDPNTLILTFFLVISYFLIKIKILRPTKISKMLDRFPGPKWIPFFGSILPVLGMSDVEISKMSFDMLKEYGGYFRLWVFNKPWFVVGDGAIIEKVLRSEQNRECPEALPFFGTGVFLSEVHDWKLDRKELKSCVNSPAILKEFIPVINQRALKLIEEIRERLKNEQDPDKAKDYTFNFFRYIVNSFSELSFGSFYKKFNGDQLVHVVETMRMGIWFRMYKPFLNVPFLWDRFGNGRPERFFKSFRKEALEFIQEKLKEKEELKEKPNLRIFDTLLSGKVRERSATNIFDNLICFYAASSDSTGCALSTILYTLAKHPHYQEKVREEILSVSGNRDGHGEFSFSLEDLEKLELLEMCIKESLRLYPVLIATGRKLTADLVIDENEKNARVIPKGTSIAILFPYSLRDPKVFPNPDAFNPERFSKEEITKLKPYDYLVFGAGPRTCIGIKYALIQLKTTLAHIITSFKVTSPAEDCDLKMFYDIACFYKGGIPLVLENISC